MSDIIDQYRKMANQARSDAAAASLPKVREVHLRSAERIEAIISRLDSVAQAKIRNDAAKRNGVSP